MLLDVWEDERNVQTSTATCRLDVWESDRNGNINSGMTCRLDLCEGYRNGDINSDMQKRCVGGRLEWSH